MRVLIFGNSVALLVNPPRTDRTQGLYVDLLRRALAERAPGSEVLNLAYGSRMVTHETEIEFVAALSRFNPDVVILHFGINEASPRAIPYQLWMWLHGPQRSGRIKGYVTSRLLRLWPTLIRMFRMGGWVSPRKFGQNLTRLIRHCHKECVARVYLVNIGPPNEHCKVMLPGIEQAILTYNHVIAKTAAAKGASLLDVFALVSREGLEKAQPDGVHLSVHGHQCLFAELVRSLVEEGLMPSSGSAATMAARSS